MALFTKKGIVWLASYPKSGNTWFRAFLSALLNEKEPDLNKLETDGIFSGKNYIERILDLNADYLSDSQVEQFQRIAFTHLKKESAKTLFLKIHDAFLLSKTNGLPLIPENPTLLAIYFVRNPLDVALSLANHINKPIDVAIDKFIVNPEGKFISKTSAPAHQFPQPMGTWDMHVQSWLNTPSFPVHFMRYEDMKATPFDTFKMAMEAIGAEVSDKQIARALDETQFEKLQKKEQEQGFVEKLFPSSSFFFKGQVDRWKEELTEEQIEKIRITNEPMMRRFGYW